MPVAGTRQSRRKLEPPTRHQVFAAMTIKQSTARDLDLCRHFRPLSKQGQSRICRETTGEARRIMLGVSVVRRSLALAHGERDGAMRLISARPATRSERRLDEDG